MKSASPVQWIGFTLMVGAVIWSNIVVSRMAKRMRVSWHVKDDQASRRAIREYRLKYGNGPLFRDFVIACGIAGVGAVVMIFGNSIFKS